LGYAARTGVFVSYCDEVAALAGEQGGSGGAEGCEGEGEEGWEEHFAWMWIEELSEEVVED
jgi:hypothetical protein